MSQTPAVLDRNRAIGSGNRALEANTTWQPAGIASVRNASRRAAAGRVIDSTPSRTSTKGTEVCANCPLKAGSTTRLKRLRVVEIACSGIEVGCAAAIAAVSRLPSTNGSSSSASTSIQTNGRRSTSAH